MIRRVRSHPDRAAAAFRSGSGGRRRRPGAAGRQVRRDVDVHELHVPVVQLPQPAGRAAVLRPRREHRRRGVRPRRARRDHDQHDADRRDADDDAERPRARKPAGADEGDRQPAPLPRRRPGRAAAELAGPALERRLRLLLRRPRRGSDAQLLPRDRRPERQAEGVRDGRASGRARADRVPARPRRRPPGRLRARARAT